jgi:hypothetical protein
MIKMTDIEIIHVLPGWVLVQYEDERQHLQRKYIPWSVFPVSRKGPNRIGPDVLDMGMEASDVDLVSRLGESFTVVSTRDLQDALRRAGLWMREDYRRNPQMVASVLRRYQSMDATTIVNAAMRGPRETEE